MKKQVLRGTIVWAAFVFLVFGSGNVACAQGGKKAAAEGGKVFYTNLTDICRDGNKAAGKVAEIGGLFLVDCFPETIQFHTGQQCVTTVGINASKTVFDKLKPYEMKKNLKVKFRITRTYIDNHHLVADFLNIAQE
jgi:hypothetical protein